MKAKGTFSVGKGGVLIPHSEQAREIAGKLNVGDRVLVHVHKARWPEHHDLAWWVFRKVGNSIGEPAEKVLLWLKVATGRVDFERLPNGKLIPLPHSISFESMSQDEFQRFWDDCWPILTEQIVPNMPDEDYEELRRAVCRDNDTLRRETGRAA